MSEFETGLSIHITHVSNSSSFIGCKSCDHKSGRRQTDLCKSGFVGKLPNFAISVNRDAERDSKYDIYRHNPCKKSQRFDIHLHLSLFLPLQGEPQALLLSPMRVALLAAPHGLLIPQRKDNI